MARKQRTRNRNFRLAFEGQDGPVRVVRIVRPLPALKAYPKPPSTKDTGRTP